jgi:hypothetical protein
MHYLAYNLNNLTPDVMNKAEFNAITWTGNCSGSFWFFEPMKTI